MGSHTAWTSHQECFVHHTKAIRGLSRLVVCIALSVATGRYISCLHVVKVESEHYLFTGAPFTPYTGAMHLTPVGSGSGDRTIRKFRMADGEFLAELVGHRNTVFCMDTIPLRGELFSGGLEICSLAMA